MYAGAFAVARDAEEDQVIMAACPTNQLIDKKRMVKPEFAYLPRLRGVQTRRGVKMVKWKRDARHYFFQLRLHTRWRT